MSPLNNPYTYATVREYTGERDETFDKVISAKSLANSQDSSERSEKCSEPKPDRMWSGSYARYHMRVRAKRGTPKHCEECGTSDPKKRYDWASLSGKFDDVNDYMRLCRPCHTRRDLGKLTKEDIETIRQRCGSGEMQKDVAKAFNVDPSLVSRYVRSARRG